MKKNKKKFQLEHFIDEVGTVLLHHNLEPKMTLQIIYDDDFPFHWTSDVFDQLKINGVIVTGLVVESETDFVEEIKKVIRRALYWYGGQVYVRKRD